MAAAIEDDAFDMDVAALHQGFLRLLRRRGGVLALRSRTGRIERRDGMWEVEVTGGAVFRAPVVVNAAGAWGDEVAAQAGAAPLGLQPKRRTGIIIDPAPWNVTDWPLLNDVAHTLVCAPEARTRLMVTPCDETDMPPTTCSRTNSTSPSASTACSRRSTSRCGGSSGPGRACAPSPPTAASRSAGTAAAEGFLWSVGQGGYGIQTSPAAGQLVADLVAGRDPGPAAGASDVNPAGPCHIGARVIWSANRQEPSCPFKSR